ncbi:MAG: DNA primase [Thermodesulfobacteriota bacterium]
MIPREKIDEVLDRASIVQVVGEYIPLKKKGANYVGLCPFHSEKTGSFTVNDDKAMYYCFGCHRGGNVIGFIMEKDGAAFVDAVQTLADRFGVRIAEDKGPKSASRDLLYMANRVAADYYYAELRKVTGKEARDYLKGRGVDKEIAAAFKIGLAPKGWDSLVGKLKKEKVALDAAVKAGVITKKDDRFFDRFRERLVFPIFDMRGRPVAFGGRELGGGEPKYLNSSESPIFDKSSTLFALNQARGEIRKKGFSLVAEGYFDVIALHSHGFTNSVATMGTALTANHIRTLKGFGNIYTIFDADEAGIKAALRGLDIFLAEDIPTRVVVLPTGMDPYDLLERDGKEKMQVLIDKAIPLMEFFFNDLKRSLDLSEVEGKRAFLDSVVPYLRRVKNPVDLPHYVRKVSELLELKVEALYKILEKEGKGERIPVEGSGPEAKSVEVKGPSYNAESVVLSVILKNPELYSDIVRECFKLFKDPFLSKAALFVSSFLDSGGDLTSPGLSAEIDDPNLLNWISGVLLREDDGFIASPEKMLADCMERVRGAGLLKPSTLEQIKKLEEAGKKDIAELMRQRAQRQSTIKITR